MSYKVYPVIENEFDYNGYEVKINNKQACLNTARVSAMPFNRRWPGHQRSIDQSELVNFLSMETDEELSFDIKPNKPFDNVVIRPKALGITPKITDDGHIVFNLKKPAYFTVEPYGRHNALHIFADPISNYDNCKNDENIIYFGPGEHEEGMINLESNQTLFIDEGAVVYGCVHAIDADNIKICGRGILDNSKNKEEILFEANEKNNDTAVNNALRKHTIQFQYCNNIEIEGITIRDSLVYNIRPVACKNINIKNVKIIGCWRYNSDGIDMHNCTDVNIENCFIRTFDDSICVKGFDCYYEGDVEKAVHDAMYRNGNSYDVFKNVLVKNCVIWNDWGRSLEIGAETRAEEICNITFDNCDIIHATHAVLDCQNVDYADIHDVKFKNITIELEDVMDAPILQTDDEQQYCNNELNYSPDTICVEVIFHYEYSAGGTRRGKNHDIVFDNINFYGKHTPKFHFTGYDKEHLVSNIAVNRFYVNGEPLKRGEYELITNEFCKNIEIEKVDI